MSPDAVAAILMAPVLLIMIGIALWLKFRKPKAVAEQPEDHVVQRPVVYAKYCTACGHVGFPAFHQQGSAGVEILLWLTFIVPGIIYSIWRSSTRKWVCASCGNSMIIPLDSPVSKQARARLDEEGKKAS